MYGKYGRYDSRCDSIQLDRNFFYTLKRELHTLILSVNIFYLRKTFKILIYPLLGGQCDEGIQYQRR